MATGNIAKNDITGKFIKSDPPTAKYTENFDAAFNKKSLQEWYLGEEIIIDNTSEYDTLVSYSEFKNHLRNNKKLK